MFFIISTSLSPFIYFTRGWNLIHRSYPPDYIHRYPSNSFSRTTVKTFVFL